MSGPVIGLIVSLAAFGLMPFALFARRWKVEATWVAFAASMLTFAVNLAVQSWIAAAVWAVTTVTWGFSVRSAYRLRAAETRLAQTRRRNAELDQQFLSRLSELGDQR